MARDAGTGRTRCGPALREAGDAPQALPPVASKHLLAAWDLASNAARVALPGVARGFRFENGEAVCLDLLIADPDAACWIAGIEDRLDLGTRYGLSVCLRLLALVQLLARRDWAARLALSHAEGIRLDPALLRAAAEAGLTAEAQFDEQDLLSRLPKRAATGAQTGA